jgi:hypothetical protein
VQNDDKSINTLTRYKKSVFKMKIALINMALVLLLMAEKGLSSAAQNKNSKVIKVDSSDASENNNGQLNSSET